MMTDNKELGALRQRHAEAEAEVARLRSVEADFHQLSDVAGWHHGETQIALARAKQAEADLAALRLRHDAAHNNWMTAERLAASKQDELDAQRLRHEEAVAVLEDAEVDYDAADTDAITIIVSRAAYQTWKAKAVLEQTP